MSSFRRHLSAAAVLPLAGGAAKATDIIPDPPGADSDGGGNVIVGVICNTSAQDEHYLRLRADGAQLLSAVDKQANEPRACGMATVAFRRDKTMDTQRFSGGLVSVARIALITRRGGCCRA